MSVSWLNALNVHALFFLSIFRCVFMSWFCVYLIFICVLALSLPHSDALLSLWAGTHLSLRYNGKLIWVTHISHKLFGPQINVRTVQMWITCLDRHTHTRMRIRIIPLAQFDGKFCEFQRCIRLHLGIDTKRCNETHPPILWGGMRHKTAAISSNEHVLKYSLGRTLMTRTTKIEANFVLHHAPCNTIFSIS